MYTLNNNIGICFLFVGLDMIMDDKIIALNIENFCLPNNYIGTCPKPPKKPRNPRLTGNFLKGPIPIAWLMKASALPGKASQIGLVLRHLRGLRKNDTVILANGLLEQFHISREAKYRCLKALEGAGLLTAEGQKDRNPRILLTYANASRTSR
jgi:hypothetical protein